MWNFYIASIQRITSIKLLRSPFSKFNYEFAKLLDISIRNTRNSAINSIFGIPGNYRNNHSNYPHGHQLNFLNWLPDLRFNNRQITDFYGNGKCHWLFAPGACTEVYLPRE